MKKTLTLVGVLAFLCGPFSFAFAGEADVIAVQQEAGSDRVYRFSVTVQHADTGWDHYADKWEVLDEQGVVLATRVLHHPHVDEQPFTRSLSGVRIPAHVRTVTIRAHDSVHAYGGKEIAIDLP